MAEQKELRHMNRTELIEIIYALQQEEQDLRREIKELSERLDDRTIRLDSVGSIAEAALSLNHIFEDAQAAADQYLLSIQDGTLCEESVNAAHKDAEEILDLAESEAERILTSAQMRADEIRRQGKQEAANERDKFLTDVRNLLNENPELAAALQERSRRRIAGDE